MHVQINLHLAWHWHRTILHSPPWIVFTYQYILWTSCSTSTQMLQNDGKKVCVRMVCAYAEDSFWISLFKMHKLYAMYLGVECVWWWLTLHKYTVMRPPVPLKKCHELIHWLSLAWFMQKNNIYNTYILVIHTEIWNFVMIFITALKLLATFQLWVKSIYSILH